MAENRARQRKRFTLETAVEPIVCRNVWGEIPGSPAFLVAFDHTPFVPW
jgi:hypothetical protein